MVSTEKMKSMEQEFRISQKVLTAFGDEVRQKLLILMLAENCSGVRAVDLAEKTSLTRSAVSHHLQILKDAGVVKCRKDGKCIYYYLDSSCNNLSILIKLFSDIRCAIQESFIQNEEALKG